MQRGEISFDLVIHQGNLIIKKKDKYCITEKREANSSDPAHCLLLVFSTLLSLHFLSHPPSLSQLLLVQPFGMCDLWLICASAPPLIVGLGSARVLFASSASAIFGNCAISTKAEKRECEFNQSEIISETIFTNTGSSRTRTTTKRE